MSEGNLCQFRIITGSYEHNLLCLSLIVPKDSSKTPIFQPIFHFESHSLSIYCINSSKRYLVTGSKDEHIKIYDLQKRKELGDLLAHQGSINTLKFSSNGKWLLSGSNDKQIIIWGVTANWELFGRLKGHKEAINDLAIHPSNKVAISCSNDNTLRLWNLMTLKNAAVLKLKYLVTKAQKPNILKWSTTGDFFIVGLLNRVLIYSTLNSKIRKIIQLNSSIMNLELVQISDKEYLVISLNNSSIEFYDFEKLTKKEEKEEDKEEEEEDDEKAEPEFKLLGHTNRVKDFKFYKPDSCDITFLISISSDGKIVVWNLNDREQIAVYDSNERLNCLEIVPESVEKSEMMKKRGLEVEDNGYKTESEYETDGEESKKILFGTNANKKKRSKNKKVKKESKAFIEIE